MTHHPKARCPNHRDALVERHSRYGRFWVCPRHDCDVMMGNTPHATPADKATRQARLRFHEAFDRLWMFKDGPFYRDRNAGYAWLASKMGIRVDQCHGGMFTLIGAELATRIVRDNYPRFMRRPLPGWYNGRRRSIQARGKTPDPCNSGPISCNKRPNHPQNGPDDAIPGDAS